MKHKIMTLLFAATLLALCMLSLAACHPQSVDDPTTPTEPSGSTDTLYEVRVRDSAGAPAPSGTVVTFFRDGAQVAMQVCDADGLAAKSLAPGDYTVTLRFTSGEDRYYISSEDLTLSAQKTALEVTLYPKASGAQVELSIPLVTIDEDGWSVVTPIPTMVYSLNEGCTYVEMQQSGKTYFLFTPTRGGIYELSVLSGEGCTFAYYGSPNYIRDIPMQDIVEGVCTVNIENAAVTGDPDNTIQLVLAVESEQAGSCIVRIDRVSDPAWSVSQEPWIIYQTTAALTQCTVPAQTKLNNFDLTRGYDLVYNESDGTYHLNSADGPQVYAYLTKDPRFVACFQTILSEGSVRAYFYDADGNFVKKEAYGTCLKEYIACADQTYGVYPLTQDLKYIIQSYGERQGWWKQGSMTCMIDIDDLNEASAWLFMCCYAE